MKTGMIISATLHGLAILAMIFGLPSNFMRRDFQETPILIELVRIDDITTRQKKPVPVKNKAPPKPKPKPKAKAKPKPPPPPSPALRP